MQYRFTDEELFRIWKLSRTRNRKSFPGANKYHWNRNQSSQAIHYDGLRAEWAVAKLLGTEVDTRHFPDGGDKHEPDLVLPGGTRIQVKYRGKAGWDFALASNDIDEFKADIGVLVYPGPDEDSVEVAGWLTRSTLVTFGTITNYLKKPGHDRLALAPEHLKPFEELVEEINETTSHSPGVQDAEREGHSREAASLRAGSPAVQLCHSPQGGVPDSRIRRRRRQQGARAIAGHRVLLHLPRPTALRQAV